MHRAWLALLAALVAVHGTAAFAYGRSGHHWHAAGAGTLALSASAYGAAQSAGSATISVTRSGGTTGAVSVSYLTADGTAKAGSTYTSRSGTLSWAAGDASARSFSVPLNAGAPLGATATFSVALVGVAGGATLGTPATATVTVQPAVTASTGTLSLSAASYVAPAGGSTVTVTVARSGGSSGAASVHYATANGSAIAGTDYTATSGTLAWASGDAAAKSLAIPVTGAASSAGKNFSVALSGISSGATLGSPSAATVTVAAAATTPPPATGLAVSVYGNHLVDAQGKTLQLRGINVAGLESVAIDNWSKDPWGGQTGTPTPQWSTMASWGANSVRLPLNEASWLGYTCTNANGTTENPDPGGNYKATVTAAVNAATSQGFYVILDLHWTSPGKFCPKTQDVMADADNAPAFWSSVAAAFKGYPNVLFEPFNEPILFSQALMMNGGAQSRRISEAGTLDYSWTSAGYNQLIAAIRATGAGNVILVGALNYSTDLSQWLTSRPVDSLGQVAAVWHAYPGYGCAFNTACYDLPNYGQASYTYAAAISAAGVPVVITEYGDQDTAGTTTAPFASRLLPWADSAGVSYLGWTWDNWANPSFVLIKDAAGDPSAGYGEYVKAHYQCRAAGSATCP
jgi:hypothetical protein